MSKPQDLASETTKIVCGANLDISNIEHLFEKLRNVLNSSDSNIYLDGESIERIDTASLQLLAAFFKDAKLQGVNLHWLNPSDALKSTCQLMGLSSFLGLDDAK